MSNAITDMIESGWKEGFIIGFRIGYRIGRAEITVKSVEYIQMKCGLSLQETCVILGKSVEDYEKAKVLLQKESDKGNWYS